MTTLTTLLTSVTRVNEAHGVSVELRFIPQEKFQTSEAPTVNGSSSSSTCFNSLSNISKVFQHEQRALLVGCDQLFAKNVVTVTAETVFPLAKFFQVLLSRVSAFRLKSFFQTEISLDRFSPSPLAKEQASTCYSRTFDTKVHPKGRKG